MTSLLELASLLVACLLLFSVHGDHNGISVLVSFAVCKCSYALDYWKYHYNMRMSVCGGTTASAMQRLPTWQPKRAALTFFIQRKTVARFVIGFLFGEQHRSSGPTIFSRG